MAAGLLISALLFYLTLQLTNRAWWAALLGMTYNLDLAQLFYEANLTSETMTTLAVTGTVSLLFFVSGQLYRGARIRRGLGAPGLAAGGLVRSGLSSHSFRSWWGGSLGYPRSP